MNYPFAAPDCWVIRRIAYRFAVLAWTNDCGWVWFCNVQRLKVSSPLGLIDVTYAHPKRWWVRSWHTPTACRQDGKVYMRHEPERIAA